MVHFSIFPGMFKVQFWLPAKPNSRGSEETLLEADFCPTEPAVKAIQEAYIIKHESPINTENCSRKKMKWPLDGT